MSGFLTPDELARLKPAETASFASPIPTQIVSSDEFFPRPQNEKQREVEARMKSMGRELSRRQGMSRRDFFSTAAGMAAAFVAMNEVYGSLFDVTLAETLTLELAEERARSLADQFVFDGHTHFLRDDSRLMFFVKLREAVRDAGWNRRLKGKQTIEELKYDNFFKEMFLDSDTKVAIISSAPSDIPQNWFLTNEMMAQAREKVNKAAGSRRLLSHAIFTPGTPGWLEDLDRALALKPDSVKGYTIGDVLSPNTSRHPWRMDDEKVTYRAYEKFEKAGIKNVCVHKGLFPPSAEQAVPKLLRYTDVSDVAKAAKDWPRLNFIIYHAGYRFVGGGNFEADAAAGWAQIDRAMRVGEQPRRDPGQARSEECIRRSRAGLRGHPRHEPASRRVHARHARERTGRRPRRLGHGRSLDGLAAVADRRAPTAGDPRRHAAQVRLQAARTGRRAGEVRDPGRQQRSALPLRASGLLVQGGPFRGAPGRLSEIRAEADQPAVRVRQGAAGRLTYP
jgi:hypothetical protein